MSRILNCRAPVALLAFAACFPLTLSAQNIQGLPRVSPAASVSQAVGITEITVDYHRPAVNGREIYGALIPYDQVWRAGANDNTTISFSQAVKMGGQEVAAGTYGLHMLPGKEAWSVILSSNSTSWGSFSYDEAEDVLRVSTQAVAAPFHERLTYVFSDVSNESAQISLIWEELSIPFTVEVDTHDQVVAKIQNDLRHLPGFNWQGWSSAANYMINNDIDNELTAQWTDRALQMNRAFPTMQLKARLLRHAGDTEAAMALEEESLAAATEAQVNVMGYQRMNAGDLEGAITLFQRNAKDHPDSWNCYDSLAEAYGNQGETEKAIELYAKARSMAPEAQHGRIDSAIQALQASD